MMNRYTLNISKYNVMNADEHHNLTYKCTWATMMSALQGWTDAGFMVNSLTMDESNV